MLALGFVSLVGSNYSGVVVGFYSPFVILLGLLSISRPPRHMFEFDFKLVFNIAPSYSSMFSSVCSVIVLSSTSSSELLFVFRCFHCYCGFHLENSLSSIFSPP